MTEQEILQKMREHVAQAGGESNGVAGAGRFNSNGVFSSDAPDLNLQELENLVNEVFSRSLLIGNINPRPPGLHNKLIQFSKKIIRRFLTWYIRPVQEMNMVLVGSLQKFVSMHQQHIHNINSLNFDLKKLISQVGSLTSTFEEFVSTSKLTQHRLDTKLEELRRMHIYETLQHQEAALRKIEYRLESISSGGVRLEQATHPNSPSPAPPEKRPELNFDYVRFQERYRGSEELIKKRQRSYLKHFLGRAPIMDLGCGRGEFLELLREQGIPGLGVESGLDAFLLCKEKGLKVQQSNLFEVLESSPDDSLGGVFSSQVIEHLPVELQLRLLDLCYRKLKPGSPVLIETINPECVFALVRNFYLDPTHIRPVHPDLLHFAMESKGFDRIELIFSSPVEGKHVETLPVSNQFSEIGKMREAVLAMNQFLFGYQDYAALGWRP